MHDENASQGKTGGGTDEDRANLRAHAVRRHRGALLVLGHLLSFALRSLVVIAAAL